MGQCREPLFGDQQGLRLVARLAQQNLENNLALGDEMSLASDQIAFAYVTIGGNTRVQGVVDGDQRHARIS